MRLLFVCLGNICRSPAAETVLRDLLGRHGLAAQLEVDSAGTAGYHIGKEPDPRTRQSLQNRGYTNWSRSRIVTAEDFVRFDLILAMDLNNLRELQRLCPSPELQDKIKLATSFCTRHSLVEVPDPYYGSQADFELVLDLAEDFSQNIVLALQDSRLLSS